MIHTTLPTWWNLLFMEKVFQQTVLHFLTVYLHRKSFSILFLLSSCVFADSLNNLQNLVENKFCDIRDIGRKPFSFPGHPCSSEHLQVYYLHNMTWQFRLADACALVYVSCSLADPCQSSSHQTRSHVEDPVANHSQCPVLQRRPLQVH